MATTPATSASSSGRSRAAGSAPGCTRRHTATVSATSSATPIPLTNPACRLAHTRNSGGSAHTQRVEPSRQRARIHSTRPVPSRVITWPRTPRNVPATPAESSSAAARNGPGTRRLRGIERTAASSAAVATSPITSMGSQAPAANIQESSTS